jgi:predicted GNAT family acetyltransferase
MQESASASAFVADLLDRYSALPGALGPPPVAKSFADSWIARTGGVARLARHERIHQCDRVIDPPAVPGSIREINDSDLTLLLRWMRQFSLEVFPEQNPADAQLLDTIQRRRSASDGGFFVWEVAGELVTMAACGGRTPNGIRVGPVYTPPERRTLGYATALVAAVTSLMLQRGLRFCCLFTDLSNPTSNSIYRKVGYVPVTDIDQYAFDSR